MNHRYTLQPYRTIRSRFTCPQCGQPKKFKRYIDTQTGAYLADHAGRCDRADKCGYHYTPKQYFADNPGITVAAYQPAKPQPVLPHSTLPPGLMQKSCGYYHQNYFAHFLGWLYGDAVTQRLISEYHIGTSKHWYGACIFWQVDARQKVRTGKIMLYNAQTGKRVKQPFNHIAWVHNILGDTDYQLKQCLFGEHLLPRYPHKTVALVESEKTAVIAAGFMPEYLWLAAGSLEGLNPAKCKVLKGRNVILFPDMDGFFKWQDKARELNDRIPAAIFQISDFMQRNVLQHQRQPGMDIADMYINEHFRQVEMEREWGLRE